MESSRLSRSVRRITTFGKDPSGTLVPVTVYRQSKDKKKGSRLLRPIETAVRQWASAAEASAAKYLEEHRRSSRKCRDGWVRDLPSNTWKASRKGAKQLKVYRVVRP